jgi:hypothetical protein
MADRFTGSSTRDNVAAIASPLPRFAGFAEFPLADSLAEREFGRIAQLPSLLLIR